MRRPTYSPRLRAAFASKGASPALPEATTSTYTFAQVGSGWAGLRDETRTAGRMYLAALQTIWAGMITGTEAVLLATGGAQATGSFQVSIDGGAWTDCVYTPTSQYTLFTGLPHAARFVAVRASSAQGTFAYAPTTGNMLRVTGQPPSVTPYANWSQPGDGLMPSSQAMIASSAGYTPTMSPDGNDVVKQNIGSIALRGTFTELVVLALSRYAFVSVDGAMPTRYDLTDNLGRPKRITGLSGLHTYYVWSGPVNGVTSNQVSSRIMAAGLGAKETFSIGRHMQLGDSITRGETASSRGDTDTFLTAAARGKIGQNFGVGGDTATMVDTRLTTILAELPALTAADEAVIAVGRNGSGGLTPVTSMINKLLTAGCTKIIVRGVLAESGLDPATSNAELQTIVASFADARVKFCDVSTWTGVEKSDGVHPTDAGYITMRGYTVPAYQALFPV
jgi:lysophospholipase L1-like esterase